ncbi:phosphoribosylanthranilate isomerase [Thalassoporum mexicanum PCC 7367]|uniref:phosphoribosylanthranilate isomerase n=1 Tax=Thalassoporum mexicanum TaxID=3457544 RepID=UPI00029F85C3|nr:phosphoribosylanthranilate isomerase [Pseudanabaena sp. PCC 7367]AFY71081.1 phosphoribosylanthranilate isomerase [Pseudanabaena sp. PCC 7367]
MGSQYIKYIKYIKICGITKPAQATAIARAGANGLGFICVKKSPRYVEPERIREIVNHLDRDVALNNNQQSNNSTDASLQRSESSYESHDRQAQAPYPDRIGVFLDASLAEIYTTVVTGSLNIVQLHGHESPQFCQELRQKLAAIDVKIKLIKALNIKSAADLAVSDRYAEVVDILLLDAYDPKLAGGTGKTIDWQLLANFHPGCDWWLAGGLAPENILTAIELTNPDGVDVSSGVERSPGDKDLTRVAQLIKLVRQETT